MATAPVNVFGDTANAVLNTARARVDDLLLTPAGSPTGSGTQLTQVGGMNLLAELDSSGNQYLPTLVLFNSAWRKFQKYLSSFGYRLLIETAIISNIPANTQSDVAAESWISWNGSFNGATLAATPALPADFYAPLKLRERVHGTGAFSSMVNALDGLLNLSTRAALNRQWLWQNGALYFTGASGATDIQVRYIRFYPDLVDNLYVSGPWYYQPMQIPGCLSALAWFVAYEVVVARAGEQVAAGALVQGQAEADQIYNDQARADQRTKQVNESFPRPGAQGVQAEGG